MIDFFMKLFKAFNSSQTPWQMSLAIALGMAMGLTPFSGWQSVIIILLALIINIHLGLFIVASGFFAAIAYMFDPIFESIGYYILTNPALADIFTSAYNSSITRTTYFNNTLVMGTSIVALVLIVPIYFALNKIVYIYRDKIATTLQKYTIFKTLGISVSDKKDKFLRIWGFGLFAVLAGLSTAFILLFLDPLTKFSLEKSISIITNKDVEIDSVDVSLKEGSLTINELNVFKNGISSLKTELIAIDLDFNQLFFNRYHIENVVFKGMEFNQVTDAKVKEESPKSSAASKEKSKSEKSSFEFNTSSLPKPEDLIARMGLSSTKNYEQAAAKFENIEKKYKDAIEKNFSKEELNRIKSDAENIKTNFNKIKGVKNITPEHLSLIKKTLDDVKKLRKELKQKKQAFKVLKNEFSKDKKELSSLTNKIVDGAKGDYKNLSENYRFNKQGGLNVVGVVFGKDIKEYTSTFLTYYDMVKPYLKSEEEPPAPPRGEGRWIRFKELNSQVDMLVKNIDLSGVYKLNSFSANMKNISSNQELLNKPFKLKLESEGKLSKSFDLGLTKLNSAELSIDAKAQSMDYVTILADTKLQYSKAKFSTKELNDLNSFNVDIALSEEIVSPKIKVKSDLDEKLKDIFAKVIKQKLQEYKGELKKLIDENMKEKLAELGLKNKDIAELQKVLNGSLDDFVSIDSQLNNQEKGLKSKSTDAVKDKAKEKVNDLLKSFKF
ncbi:TIGR03545 family protein [Sulfurimonas sp.]|uniref:TIGR03545 family protein n=1 Tax=Sulfurimonas sp. TaxID=2022749 RepID=UPI0035637A3D